MQISRHWRLNAVRYRLQGVRYENGETSLQNRPGGPSEAEVEWAVTVARNLSKLNDFRDLNPEGARNGKESAA